MSNVLVVEFGMTEIVHYPYWEHDVYAKLDMRRRGRDGHALNTSRRGPPILAAVVELGGRG
jgi:hypothetical protein